MENTLSVSLMVICLVLGAVAGTIMFSAEGETIVLPGEDVITTEYITQNISVEVPVADVSQYLDQAVEDFMEYVDDEDDMLECGRFEYNFDEITVAKVYDAYSVDIDDEDYVVNFKIKLEYDEDDERSCRETYEVEASYVEDEDVEITIN